MKLLHVIHYPVFGGPHNQALRLNKPLADQGWSTLVALPTEPGSAAERLREGGVRVRQLKLKRLRATPSLKLQLQFLADFLPGVRRLRALIRDEGVDLVMLSGLVNPHAAVAARLESKPVVWQILDVSTPKPLVRAMMPVVKWLADSVLVTGIEVAAAHPGAESFEDRLVSYVPPVDVDEFTPNETSRLSARRELGLGDEDIVVGFISNVNPDKDQMTFVEAAGVLRGTRPEVRFLIMGATYPHHEAYLKQLEQRARVLGLNIGTDLIFFDPGSEVAHFGAALDVFWLTSRSEGIPTVVLEAMSLGLPVVATDVGSVRRVVEDGRTGFVVPARDSDAFARRTVELLADAGMRKQFGERSRSRAEREFSVEQCAEAHLTAFAAAIAHARARLAR